MPFTLKHYINRKIDSSVGYYGSVSDIDLSIFKNTYLIKNIRVIKDTSKIKQPLFQAEGLLFTFNWTDLFKGGISGSATLYSPILNYTLGKKPEQTQAPSEAKPLTDILENILPFRIDIFKIKNGKINYLNAVSSPEFNFYATNVQGKIENLTNSKKLSSSLYASANFTAKAMENGFLTLKLLINPISEIPLFKLDGTLNGLNLTNINDYVQAKSKIKFNSGTLDFTTKLNSGGDKVKGYAVMDIENLEIASIVESLKGNKSLTYKFAEVFSESASELMELRPDKIHAKVNISTPIKKGRPDMIATVVNAIRSAFVDAFISRITSIIPHS